MIKQKRSRVITQQASIDYCRACRQRRVRCDSRRPACTRCVKAGRKCEFNTWEVAFSSPDTPTEEDWQLSAPDIKEEPDYNTKDVSNRNSFGSPGPPILLPPVFFEQPASILDNFSLSAFEYFVHVGARAEENKLTFSANGHKANGLAISRSTTEPIFLLSLAATGLAWQAVLPMVHATVEQPFDTASLDLAFQLYYRALAEIRQRLDSHLSSPAALEFFTLCYWVIFGFQMSVSNAPAGLRILRYGRSVTQRFYAKWADAASPAGAVGLVFHPGRRAFSEPPGLVPCATEWELGLTGVQSDPFACSVMSTIDQIPPVFVSTEEAYAHFNRLEEIRRDLEMTLQRSAESYMQQSLRTISMTLSVLQRQCLKHVLARVIDLHEQTYKQLEHLSQSYDAWHGAFAALSEGQRSKTAGMLYLSICSFGSRFSVQTSRDTTERACDRFRDEFLRIVALAEQYLRQREGEDPRHFGPLRPKAHTRTVAMEWGVIRVIYLIGIKCRDPRTRRRASNLLKSAQRREGSLESEELARYAESIINLEEADGVSNEAHVLPGIFSDQIREEVRFSDVVAMPRNDGSGVFSLACARFAHERHGQVELVTHTRKAYAAHEEDVKPFQKLSSVDIVEIAI